MKRNRGLGHSLLLIWALLLSSFALIEYSRASQNDDFALEAVSGADGSFEVIQDNGKSLRRSTGADNYSPYMYFRVPKSARTLRGPLYVQVDYKDCGSGVLGLQYNASGKEDYRAASRGFGRQMRGTNLYGVAVFELAAPDFRGAQNMNADLRLTGPGGDTPLCIVAVRLLTRAPISFVKHTAQPWLAPYRGARRNDVNASSLRGKVLCGYQGWFRAPSDSADSGWVHWSRNASHIAPETLTVDMWPDMAEYKNRYPADAFKNADGSQAFLFSSADEQSIDLHFDWMQKYGIDGVFVQQFLSDFDNPGETARTLGWARRAANRTGRVFALEFDMSGQPPEKALPAMEKYWHWLVDTMKITDDPRYLHQDGKPVLAIFGFFPDRFSGAEANRILDAFQKPGKYQVFLAGSGQRQWRVEKDADWAKAFRRMNAILPWAHGYTYRENDVERAQTDFWQDDLAEAKRNDILYMPVIYPGFSWNNLQRTTNHPTQIARRGGDFYWEQFQRAKALGINTVFVAMFDEVDEGTAIFKVTDAPPQPGFFVTYEGKPSDFYLQMTGKGTRFLRGNTSSQLPPR